MIGLPQTYNYRTGKYDSVDLMNAEDLGDYVPQSSARELYDILTKDENLRPLDAMKKVLDIMIGHES